MTCGIGFDDGDRAEHRISCHEVMQRIAAPMIGGMITAPLLSLFVIPAAYRILRRRELAAGRSMSAAAAG